MNNYIKKKNAYTVKTATNPKRMPTEEKHKNNTTLLWSVYCLQQKCRVMAPFITAPFPKKKQRGRINTYAWLPVSAK